MESRDTKPSEAERKESRRRSSELPAGADQDEVFYDAMIVSDGFRPRDADITPSLSTSSQTSFATEGTDATPPSPRSHSIPVSPVSPLSRPSSIAKVHGPHDSLSLRHDGAMGHLGMAGQSATSMHQLSRGVSVSISASGSSRESTNHMSAIPIEEPYQGPSGPSHPYRMYPQDVRINRTMSVATTSTVEPIQAPEQPYAGPRGPAHPYGLYSQNTVTGQAAAGDPIVHGVTVGFPGAGADQYRRRIGPDGEDMADLIGPDGHTEALPPYTRYPDEQYTRKVREAEEARQQQPQQITQPAAVVQAVPRTASSLQPIPGAGGMGMAARNPEFDSVDDLHSPRSRHSSRSFASTSEISDHAINTAAAGVANEKEKPATRWQRAGRKRLCGVIPYYAILLFLLGMLIMGVVLGSVIGTVVAKKKKSNDSAEPQGAAPIFDAVPIPIPVDLPDLPQGPFGMYLNPQQTSNVCFNNTAQAQTWSCNYIIGVGPLMNMDINTNSDGSPYSISISANETTALSNGIYAYGTQPHSLQGTHTLQTVNDTLEPTRGSAWFMMVTFNKTVIVPENQLTATTTTSASRLRRRAYGGPVPFGSSDFRRRAALPGDKPWVCTWPETVLEVFIYPKQNTNPPKPPPGGSPNNNGGQTTAPPAASATRPAPPFFSGGGFGSFSGSFAPQATSIPTPSGLPTDGGFGPPGLPGYPKVVKVEERRVQGSPQPICRQMVIEQDGSAKPVMANGKPVEVVIVEVGNSKPLSKQQRKQQKKQKDDNDNGRRDVHQLFPRDSADISDCGCLWFMT